jgi:hypothetical protein
MVNQRAASVALTEELGCNVRCLWQCRMVNQCATSASGSVDGRAEVQCTASLAVSHGKSPCSFSGGVDGRAGVQCTTSLAVSHGKSTCSFSGGNDGKVEHVGRKKFGRLEVKKEGCHVGGG